MTKQKANQFFEDLLQSIEWKNDEAIIFGKHIITKRKVAWYGDSEYAYTYSNMTKQALALSTPYAAAFTAEQISCLTAE